MLTRVTYLVAAPVKDFPTAVSNLSAFKHILLKKQIPIVPGQASIEFANEQVDMPLDPPAYTGLRGFSSSILTAELLYDHFGLKLPPPQSDGDFITFVSNNEPEMDEIEGLQVHNASAWRLSLSNSSSTTSEISLELFYKRQLFSEPVFPSTLAVSEAGILQSSFMGDTYFLTGKSKKPSGKPKPISFLWGKRDYNAELDIAAGFKQPYGLHPVMQLNISNSNAKPMCALYTLLNLPADMILDEYELQNLEQIKLMGLWGQKDLENPEWAEHMGVSALFRLPGTGNFELPMHFRYKLPDLSMKVENEIPRVECFYVCKTEEINRELRPHELIGPATFFPNNSMFLHSQSNAVDYAVATISPLSEEPVIMGTQLIIGTGLIVVLISVLIRLFKRK